MKVQGYSGFGWLAVLVVALAVVLGGCQTTQEVKPTVVTEFEGLYSALDDALNAETKSKFIPSCGEEYTTNIYNRLLVKDCENLTAEEERQMSVAIVRKARSSANAVCSMNEDCTDGKLRSYRYTRHVCESRLWEVDTHWRFVCE